MKSQRQQLLLRRMRRSLIALRIQTPQPVLHRISRHWYFAVVAVLVLITALVSTRSALLFRAEVGATQARVIYVQKANLKRRQARAAALIDYQQRPRRVEASQVAEVEPDIMPVTVPNNSVIERAPAKSVALPKISAVVISSRYAKPAPPQSIDEAFHRLLRAEDNMALSWLTSRSPDFQYDPAWEKFQQAQTAVDTPLRAYQIGVLFGALGDELKAYRWSASAASSSNRARYIRAHAVAADRLGKRNEAAKAYRRYLAVAPATESSQVERRLAVLESP